LILTIPILAHSSWKLTRPNAFVLMSASWSLVLIKSARMLPSSMHYLT
jgi:hypothetical protein